MARRAIRIGVVLASAVLALAGCIRAEVLIEIADDGSGVVEIELLFHGDVVYDQYELSGEVMPAGNRVDVACDVLAETGPELLANLMVVDQEILEPASEGDFCGFKTLNDLPASLNHTESMGEIFESGSSLLKVGDEWLLDLRFGLLSFGEEFFPEAEYRELLQDARYTVIVDLPGVAVDGGHNATKVDGGRFTWEIDVLNPELRDFPLLARTAPGPGFELSWQLMAMVLAVAIGIAGASVISLRSKRAAS